MAKDYDDGESGAVRGEQYCMPSWQKDNVDEMTDMMGYHKMSDMANTKKAPVQMTAAKRNVQLSPELPAPDMND